jgi:potassium-transporting ATPase KdpC subunit
MTIVAGVLYPSLITVIAQSFFDKKSHGSLIKRGNTIIGSELIGQEFKSPHYFWPRPSASNYSALPSMGSNLGPTNKNLAHLIEERRHQLSLANKVALNEIPEDLLTASGSGLDPHISIKAARIQIERIVTARHLGPDGRALLEKLIEERTEHEQFSVFGEKRINVLLLNLALDEIENSRKRLSFMTRK